MGFLLTTVLLMLGQVVESREAPQVLATLSVCDLIANDPTKLNGKVIKVRGILGGTDEGIWLGL